MTSWYHFSKSRAGSRTGPPGSCCSIWREMPHEKGGRAKCSERDRRTEMERSEHPCLHLHHPPEQDLQTPGDPERSLAEPWQLRDPLAAQGAGEGRRKHWEGTGMPCPVPRAGQGSGRWQGTRRAGKQQPGQGGVHRLARAWAHPQLTPSRASPSPPGESAGKEGGKAGTNLCRDGGRRERRKRRRRNAA